MVLNWTVSWRRVHSSPCPFFLSPSLSPFLSLCCSACVLRVSATSTTSTADTNSTRSTQLTPTLLVAHAHSTTPESRHTPSLLSLRPNSLQANDNDNTRP